MVDDKKNALSFWRDKAVNFVRCLAPAKATNSTNNFETVYSQIRESGLFDDVWYEQHYSNDSMISDDPLTDYILVGASLDRNPNFLFDSRWYRSLFMVSDELSENPLFHYLQFGAHNNADPSPYFNSSYYRRRYPDVAQAGLSPYRHFLATGARENRKPNCLFDGAWYKEQYGTSGTTDFIPFIDFVQTNRKLFSPWFDSAWYNDRYEHRLTENVSGAEHFLNFGMQENFDPNPYFDSAWYLRKYPEVAMLELTPFEHYSESSGEGFSPSQGFDGDWYRERHVDVKTSRKNSLYHFLGWGRAEGRAIRAFDYDPRGKEKIAFISFAEQTKVEDRLLSVEAVFRRSFGIETRVVTISPQASVDVTVAVVRELAKQGFDKSLCISKLPDYLSTVMNSMGMRFVMLTDDNAVDKDYAFSILRQFEPGLKKTSVVVPNYNYARFLEARLKSIFDQSMPIYELIVLDDASTDSSSQVLEELRLKYDRDFSIVQNENNSGSVFLQWLSGTKLARGEFVWIAEADDLSSSHFLRASCAAMQNDSTNVVFSNSRQIDQDGKPLADNYDAFFMSFAPLSFSNDFEISSRDFLKICLSTKVAIANVSSALFRREILLAALINLESELTTYKQVGDWRVYLEVCSKAGAVAFLNSSLNVHRKHSSSVTAQTKTEAQMREVRLMHDLALSLLSAEAEEDLVIIREKQERWRSLISKGQQ